MDATSFYCFQCRRLRTLIGVGLEDCFIMYVEYFDTMYGDDTRSMMTWLFGDILYFWMSIEMTYLKVDVMMFYSAAMSEKIIYACLVIYSKK